MMQSRLVLILFVLCASPVSALQLRQAEVGLVGLDGEAALQSHAHPRGPKDTEFPSIIDLLAGVMQKDADSGKGVSFNVEPPQKELQRAAVCSTGHIRSFANESVHSTWLHNIIHNNNSVQVDYFFMGHLGGLGHWKMPSGWGSSDQEAETIAALQDFGPNLKYKRINENGDCKDLKAASMELQQQGIDTGVWDCYRNSKYLQAAWLDRCFKLVSHVSKKNGLGKGYDLVIRSRPDIKVLQPIDLKQLSLSKVNYHKRGYGAGDDWFFTIPMQILEQYWDPVMAVVQETGGQTQLDHQVFPRNDDHSALANQSWPLLEPTTFPVSGPEWTGNIWK